MVHQEEHYASSQEAKDVLREKVCRRHRVRRVHDRGDDEETESRRDGITWVEPGPHGVDQVYPQ
ncbi:MAG: hypothetical protein WB809_02825, partial [Thermoplasmata archaeon]